MYLKTAIARVTLGNRYSFVSGDGILLGVDVTNAEQERSSSCTFSLYDPDLKLLNLLLLQFQDKGGILVPVGLLEAPKPVNTDAGTTAAGATSTTGGGAATIGNNYLKSLEAKYGASDLSGLTEVGKRALTALSYVNVQAFLTAVAIAELGEAAAAKGGYGYLYGDIGGKETFDPRTLTTHPNRKRKAGAYTSSATGRYQTLNLVWNDDTKYGSKGMGLKDFKPVSQEILAVGRMMYRNCLEDVIAGNFDSGMRKASREWASLEGNPYGQGTSGGKKSVFLGNIAKYKAQAKTGTGGTTTVATGTPTATTQNASATATPASSLPSASAELEKLAKNDATAKAAEAAKTQIDVSQGTFILVELGYNDGTPTRAFEFLLTEVRGSNDLPHVTRITGRQVRAVIAKGNKIYKTHRNTTIRQLAVAIASKVGAKVEVESDAANTVYETVRQQETDYQMLVKLAKSSGLFIRSDAKTLKLQELKPSDKKISIPKKALLAGSNWGDAASSDRLIEGMPVAATATPATTPATTTGTSTTSGAISFVIPVKGNLTQGFRPPENPQHGGIDIANAPGTPIVAAAAGTVVNAKFAPEQGESASGLGNYVEIQHAGNVKTYYGHGRKLLVRSGQTVAQGQLIMEMGNTGNSNGDHLHFEIYSGATQQFVDPIPLLPPLSGASKQPAASAPGQTNTNALPSASAALTDLDSVVSSNIKPGLQDIKSKADPAKGIGKGFEAQVNVDTSALPAILDAYPGTIVELAKDTGLGEAIARPYRIDQIRHSYENGALTTSLSLYLPVAVQVKTAASPTATTATTPTTEAGATPTGNVNLPANLQATPKKGDYIAGFLVTSPYGRRFSPGGVGSTDHKGADIGCPVGTPLYAICKPGETITVTCHNQPSGAGIYPRFEYAGILFEYYHCSSCNAGKFTYGQIIARSGSTGTSTGPHLHFQQRKLDRTATPPSAGWIWWCMTGKDPSTATNIKNK